MGRLVMVSGLVILMAGCMNAPRGPEPSPTPGGDAPVTSSVTLDVDLEGCLVSELTGFIPAEWARDLIPDDFDEFSPLPGLFDVRLRMRDCERAVFHDTVQTDLRWFEGAIVVQQDFDNSSDPGTSLVVVAFANNDALLAALHELGIGAIPADIVPRAAPLAGGSSLTGWAIDGDSFSYSFDFVESAGPTAERTREGTYWYAGPPHVRRDMTRVEQRQETQETDGVVLTLDGDTDLDRMFGDQERWMFMHQLSLDANERTTFLGGFRP